MSRAVLLGAGASVDAGVPDTLHMAREILKMREVPRSSEFSAVGSFVLSGLMFYRGSQRLPIEAVDVEMLFEAVELLADRDDLAIAPFVGSWVAAVEAFDSTEAYTSPFGVRNLADYLQRSLSGSNRGARSRISPYEFERLFSEAVRAVAPARPRRGMFRATADAMVRQLRRLVFIEDDEKVRYLSPLIDLLDRQGRLVVASLNYDNAVELMCDQRQVEVWTGIGDWSDGQTLQIPGRGLSLLKLHGSVDWSLDDRPFTPEAPLAHQIVREATDEELKSPSHRPAVLFGGGNKLTAQGPYLDLLALFDDELETTDLLVAVGYSFRDTHVNELLKRWINGRPERRLAVVDPGFNESENRFAEELRSRLKDRLIVIPERAREGLVVLVDGRL